MDSAVLLDLLGNENRRRILRLLSHKPCYVTEISEYLGVSPKAVIDHLRRLEEAGLVESRTDDKRRKYFHIARNLRLEVSVSPYRFGAKSAYPASRSLDMRGRCQHITIELPELDDGGIEAADDETEAPPRRDRDGSVDAVDAVDPDELRELEDLRESVGDADDTNDAESADSEVAELAREYAYLDDVESELSLAQRWVHGRVTDVLDSLSERLGSEADSRFYAEVLASISREARSAREIAREVNAEPERVARALERLAEQDLVARDGAEWRID
ncbi:MAG: ArsR/SmtB family transcription factor [Halobellus sp.]